MLWKYLLITIFISVLAFPHDGNAEENGVDIDIRDLFDTHQAIIDEGYPAETHSVITHDGYILEVTRIPHGKNQTKDDSARPVVFMLHGLLAAANSFIFMGPQYSIGYHLADAGFDVWMGNARGNYYSRFHVSLDPDHEEEKFEFFDFSFEEIGMYDVAAMIDYILEKTGRDQLHYIGHSQGGTAFLVLSTMRPEYNRKIRAAHLLAAVGYHDYFPNAQMAMLARMVDTIYAVAILEGLVEYFPIDLTPEEKRARDPGYCLGGTKYRGMCYLTGARELVSEDTDTGFLLAGASLKQLAHFGQNIRDKIFRRWNYGAAKNTEIYGTAAPPIYDLNFISTYVTMHYSLSDNLLDERDVLGMANDIPRIKLHRVARESFLHEDYVTATDAKEMVTNYVIEDIWKAEAGDFGDWEKTVESEEIDDKDENENDKDYDDNIGSEINDTDNDLNSAARTTATIISTIALYLVVNSFSLFLGI